MSRRLRTKILNGTLAGIAAILMLLFLLDYSNTGAPPGLNFNNDKAQHADYYLINTTNTQFDDNGILDFVLFSEEVKHDPNDDSARLKAPHFELFRDGAEDWTVDAQLGTISEDGNTLDLQQRVVVSSYDQATILKTPQLTIYPNKKLAKTDKPVTLQNPNGFTRSIGLNANMDNKRIDLLQQVRGQYQGVLFEDEQ